MRGLVVVAVDSWLFDEYGTSTYWNSQKGNYVMHIVVRNSGKAAYYSVFSAMAIIFTIWKMIVLSSGTFDRWCKYPSRLVV